MILFHLQFEVPSENTAKFERTYFEVFEPALKRQDGLDSVSFARVFPQEVVAEIEAAPTEANYLVSFQFQSEAKRRAWATSQDHDDAWPKISSLAKRFIWRGYDVLNR